MSLYLFPIGVTVGFSSTKYHANEGETVDIEVVLTGAHAVDVAVVIQVAPSVSVNAVEGNGMDATQTNGRSLV